MKILCGCCRGFGRLCQENFKPFRQFSHLHQKKSLYLYKNFYPQRIKSTYGSSAVLNEKISKKDPPISPKTDSAKDTEDTWKPVGTHSLKERVGLYAKLSKIRLSALVVLTASAGYAIAPGVFDPYLFTGTTIGTLLCSASANSFNQFMEIPYDCQMSRTRDRVLVRGLLRPSDCVYFGTVAGLLGVTVLATTVNSLTASLGLLNIFLYAGVYTPSKRFHIANTWIGSVVGAIPPLMGWAACMGHLDMGALTLAAILYSWQFPHFNALSWNYRPDYSRAGYKMMSVTDPQLCRRVTLRHSIAQIPIAAMVSYVGVAGWSFFILSLPINVYLSVLAYDFYKTTNANTARKLFRFTLLHLPLLMILLVICSQTKARNNAGTKTEISKEEEKQTVI